VSGPADRIVGLYDTHAADWDKARGKTLLERPWLDRFAAGLSPHAAILDMGCGSGEPIAGHFIAAGFAITGIDSSQALIAICKDRFPSHEWLVEDMRRLALGRRFDGLIAWDSFFHLAFDDQRRMFPIFAEHAAPGAMLMFTSGPAHGEAIGSFSGEPLYHASLDPDEYRALLGENGFEVIHHVAEDPTCGGHTIWLCRFRA
jgi:predicted TPR repeat methyltransferase